MISKPKKIKKKTKLSPYAKRQLDDTLDVVKIILAMGIGIFIFCVLVIGTIEGLFVEKSNDSALWTITVAKYTWILIPLMVAWYVHRWYKNNLVEVADYDK